MLSGTNVVTEQQSVTDRQKMIWIKRYIISKKADFYFFLGKKWWFVFGMCRRLTGQQITDVVSANRAMRQLMSAGVKTVVISSTELGDENSLLALASTVTGR